LPEIRTRTAGISPCHGHTLAQSLHADRAFWWQSEHLPRDQLVDVLSMIKRDYVHSDSGSVQITAPAATLFIYCDTTNLTDEEVARVQVLSSASESDLNSNPNLRDLLAEIKLSRATLLAFAGGQYVQSIQDNGVPGSRHRFKLRIQEGNETIDKVTFNLDLSKSPGDEPGTSVTFGKHSFGTVLLGTRIGQICTTLTADESRQLQSELSVGTMLVYQANDKEETSIVGSRSDLTEWKSSMM
jgi:hypothetical protein